MSSKLFGDDPRVELYNCDLIDFLENNTTKFDLVICSGVIYSFIDYYRILKLLVKNSSEYILINYAKCDAGVVYKDLPINSSNDGSYISIGPVFSIDTMSKLMYTLGCETLVDNFDVDLENYKYRSKGRAVSMFRVTDNEYVDNQIKLKNKTKIDKEWK